MVRTSFHASFLLAVPYLKDVPKQKKKKAPKKPKNKKKKSAEIVEEIPEVVEEKVLPYNGIMEVGKPTVFVHVEYAIVPEILVYDFDVVCYGDVAKIYTRDYNVAVKTTVRGNIAWIPFTIDHDLYLSDELLEELHASTVAVNVWTDRKKQFKTTQQDKPRRFYMYEEDLNSMFAPLDEWDANGNTVLPEVTLPSLCVLVRNSLCPVPYPEHWRTIKKLANQHSDNLQIVKPKGGGKKNKKSKGTGKGEDLLEGKEKKGGKKKKGGKEKADKKGKKEKKGKKSPLAGSEQLTMLGELFLANVREMKIEKTFESLSIPYMAVMFTVCDLFIEDQLNFFNPAVVQIRDVTNLPAQLFEKHGFEWIYISYTLPDDKEYVTDKKRVDKTVSFNDTRSMLTHNLDATTIIEFIITKPLLIKLWGVRDERFCYPAVPEELFRFTLNNRCMMSRLLPDPFSNPHAATDSDAVRYVTDKPATVVCLAETEMDISALLKDQIFVESTNNFRRPRLAHEYGATSGSWTYYNLPDVHELGRAEPINASPFTDFMLQNTTVEVAFKLLAPLTPIMVEVYQSREHYNRIVIVVEGTVNSKLCQLIVEEIYKTNVPYVRLFKPANDLFYAHKEILRPHLGEWSEEITEELEGKQHFYQSRRGMFQTPVFKRKAITGFILDNCDRVLIVVEGRAQSALLKLFCFLQNLDVSSGLEVHYNSDMAFKSRLYHDFMEMGGIMVINMDEPIEVKQMKKQFLLNRSTGGPSRAVQTINKLNNLMCVKDIATACRQDFFPSAMHLVSFAMEFGIPFRLTDGYTEAPSPSEESPSVKKTDSQLSSFNSKPDSLNEELKRASSTGFEPTEHILNMDMYGNTYSHNPGGFTLVHACSSTYSQSLFSKDDAVSFTDMPLVLPGDPPRHSVHDDNVVNNIPTAVNTGVEVTSPSVEEQTSTEKRGSEVDAKGDHLLPKQIDKKKPVNKRCSSIHQEDQQVPSPSPVSHSKRGSKATTSDNYVNANSLILHRKPTHVRYSYASPSSGSTYVHDRQQSQSTVNRSSDTNTIDTLGTPPEPPCPIQETYFRDFLSGTNVFPSKHSTGKGKQAQTTSKSQDRKVLRVVGRNKNTSHQRKALANKKNMPAKHLTTSSERLFKNASQSENSIGGVSVPSASDKQLHERRFKARPTKPETPPEPPCPLQEYFLDYYESTIFHEKESHSNHSNSII